MIVDVTLRIDRLNFEGSVKIPDDQPVREIIRGILAQMPDPPSMDDPAFIIRLKRKHGEKIIDLDNNRSLRDQGVTSGAVLILDIQYGVAGNRQTRLKNEYDILFSQFAFSPFVRFKPLRTIPPNLPVEYEVEYTDVRGFESYDGTGSPRERRSHKVKLSLGPNYPNQPPEECTMLTPIFHPNIDSSGTICIGDVWGYDRTLVELVIQIGKMIQWELLGLHSAYNQEAKRYAEANSSRLPLDTVDFQANKRTDGLNLRHLHTVGI